MSEQPRALRLADGLEDAYPNVYTGLAQSSAAELAACREREARMREALDKIAWGRAPGPLNNKLAQKYEQVAVAALAEGAQR